LVSGFCGLQDAFRNNDRRVVCICTSIITSLSARRSLGRALSGAQVAAWSSMKSFRAKDGSDEAPSGGRNGERDFHGETRS
jgi:hypothetical protein